MMLLLVAFNRATMGGNVEQSVWSLMKEMQANSIGPNVRTFRNRIPKSAAMVTK
jgi:hypothetical protein